MFGYNKRCTPNSRLVFQSNTGLLAWQATCSLSGFQNCSCERNQWHCMCGGNTNPYTHTHTFSSSFLNFSLAACSCCSSVVACMEDSGHRLGNIKPQLRGEKQPTKYILIPKTIGNRKRDCAWGWARGINTTWENLQIEKHKSGRRSFRSLDWFVLFDLQLFSGGVYPPSATSRTISFSISNSFWY